MKKTQSTPPPPNQLCKRCGATYPPFYLDGIKTWCSFCSTCMMRNLHDGLGMPTPPELLDRHTKKPTLTNEEYWRKMRPKPRKRKARK